MAQTLAPRLDGMRQFTNSAQCIDKADPRPCVQRIIRNEPTEERQRIPILTEVGQASSRSEAQGRDPAFMPVHSVEHPGHFTQKRR